MRLASYVAMLLLVAMYIAPVAGFAAKKAETKPAPEPVKTVVVFPFANDAKTPVEGLPMDLANGIQASLNHAVGYRGMAFSDRMPSMMRALQELILKAEDLKGPFGTEKPQIMTAVKIAHEMVADYVLVGSIDEVKVDVDKKTAEVTLSALLADGTTGETIKTLAVTGTAPSSTSAATEVELVSLAAGDAVTKMVKDIAPEQAKVPATTTIQNGTKKSHGLRRFLIPLLLAVGIGLAVSSGSSSNHTNGDVIDNPPGSPF
jgi:hypothetical protein